MTGGTARIRARSVIPGRQRWEVSQVLGRPDLALFVERRISKSRAVISVHVSAHTGRLLIHHDASMSVDELERLLLRALATPARPARLRPFCEAEKGLDGHGLPPLLVVGGAAAALVVGAGLASPLMRLGVVGVATVVVTRRAWRRSVRRRHGDGAARASMRHPILLIVGPHRRRLWLASSLSVVAQILDLVPSLFIGWMALVLMTGESALLVRLGFGTAASQLWFLAGATALVFLGVAAASFAANRLWQDLARSVQHEWRTRTYAHIQRTELRHLEGERKTALARVLSDDVDEVGRLLSSSADYFLKLGANLAVLVPVFVLAAPGIAWVAFLPVPVIAWLSFFHQERAAPAYADSGRSASLLNGQLATNLEASATIKSYGTEEHEIERISRLSRSYGESNRRLDTRTSAYTQAIRVCATSSIAGTLLTGGLDVLSGALSFQVFSPLIGLPQFVLYQLPDLGNAVDQYQRTVGALGRLVDLESLPVESAKAGRPLDVAGVRGELLFDQVTFTYPGRVPVLHDLTLRVAAGSTTGIVGATGSGKTTLAKLLLRFEDVDAGRVMLDGFEVRELRLDDLRRSIGFVAQEPFLFEGSVEDNIRYGTFDADREEVRAAARTAQADDFIEALPDRYDTWVGPRGLTLSGGQRQRIALARAILKAAPVLVLDEATSAVDNETEAAIQRSVAEFSRNRTTIVIAHRLSTIRSADWIYVLQTGGQVVEAGTHQQLVDQDGVYASLWRRQIGEGAVT